MNVELRLAIVTILDINVIEIAYFLFKINIEFCGLLNFYVFVNRLSDSVNM